MIEMGLENLSKYTITLRRCEEDLIIKTCNLSDEGKDVSDTTYKFQLSSLFSLLEEGKLSHAQPRVTKITSLDLSHCDLADLPKCIKILHLKNFNISHNNFTQVPSCLYGNGLQQLESLDMSFNRINQFDIEPDCVLCIKRLKLNNNCLENVPKWLLTFRCTNLEEFNYSGNKAKHYNFLKNSINLNFMKLKKLELINSCLLDQDLPWIKCFKTLAILDISNNSVLSKTKHTNKFDELDKLFVKPSWKTMEILKANSLDISFFPEGIFWIESLKELHMSNNHLSWLPNGLEYLVNLEVLDFSCNQLVFIPKQLSQLANLKILLVSGNQLDEVPAMPDHLEVLDLYDNHLEIIDYKSLEHITFLDLEVNSVDLEADQSGFYIKYCIKRDLFRDSYNVKDRATCFIKDRKEFVNSSCSSEGSNYSDYDCLSKYDFVDDNYISAETLEEDWDRESIKTPVFKHPDISLSDNEYDGEKHTSSQKNLIKMPRVYVDDEDFLFVDAD